MHSSITRQSASKMLLKYSVFQSKFNDTTKKKLTPGTINSILKGSKHENMDQVKTLKEKPFSISETNNSRRTRNNKPLILPLCCNKYYK